VSAQEVKFQQELAEERGGGGGAAVPVISRATGNGIFVFAIVFFFRAQMCVWVRVCERESTRVKLYFISEVLQFFVKFSSVRA